VYQPNPPADVIWPPTDLWSDEPPMASDWHRRQMQLLIDALEGHWHDRQDFYCSGNLTIYDSLTQHKSEDFRGPDFFVVLGCERRERRSWTVWQEGGRLPNVIAEILPDSTADIDPGAQKTDLPGRTDPIVAVWTNALRPLRADGAGGLATSEPALPAADAERTGVALV
jgi:Uma2 family endonuclease